MSIQSILAIIGIIIVVASTIQVMPASFIEQWRWGYVIFVFGLGLFSIILICVDAWNNYEERKNASDYIAALKQQVEGLKPNPDKISVFLSMAHDYPYLDATEDDQYKILNSALPIPVEFDPKKKRAFVFGVNNENKDVSLVNVRLFLSVAKDYQLEITGDSEKDKYWRRSKINEEYWFEWPYINANDGRKSWHPFFVKFPQPGTYIFRFTVTGNFNRIETMVPVSVK